MLRVGLTGGLASGKSFVGKKLAEFGCYVIKADDLGHAVLMPGGAAYEDVVSEFGRDILGADSAIDRRKLAAAVFGDPHRLAWLNSIVHPLVIDLEERLMMEAEAKNPDGIAVMEAAILIETGSYKRFQKLILAVCPDDQQIVRAMHRDRMTREEAMARLRQQMPLDEKRKYADYIVDTSGTKENTAKQTRQVYDELRSLIHI